MVVLFLQFEFLKLGRMVGDEADRRRGDHDKDGEEDVPQEDAGERRRNGDDTERPEPIRTALDMLVFVGTPTQRSRSCFGHDAHFTMVLHAFMNVLWYNERIGRGGRVV